MRSFKLLEKGAVLATLFIIVLGSLAVTRVASQTDDKDRQDEFWEFAHVFNEIFHRIQADYVEEVDADLLFRGALNGMFMALDTHSAFMGSDSFDQLEKETEGEFSGVGLHITMRDGILTVIAPIAGGPSAKLGVQPWDRIIEIDEESTEGITLPEAVRKLTGPRGTTVKVKIWRLGLMEGEVLEIKRDTIKIRSVHSKLIDDNVGYIRVSKFSDQCSREVMSMINDLADQGAQGLILDMRFNPGGLLSEAVKISDLFLDKGDVIVSTRGRDEIPLDEYLATSNAVTDLPIMILINEGSASASEIVTAALSDNHRAMVIGPEGGKTFGKGSVQTINPLSNSFEKDENGNYLYGAIKLTTALYYTPSGETIHNKGIEPDVGVKIPDGHNRDLLGRGLLGDPDVRGPENGEDKSDDISDKEAEKTGDVEDDDVDPDAPVIEIKPDAADEKDDEESKEEKGSDEPFFLNQSPHSLPTADDAEAEEEFHDVMLDEAVRLMKAHLILEGRLSDTATL